MALGALCALRAQGLHVPDDVAVVSFDDIPEAAYFCPSLTTVRQDLCALGRATNSVHRRFGGGRGVPVAPATTGDP